MAKNRREERKYKVQSAKEWAKKNDTGGSTTVKLPEGVSFWSIKSAGSRKLDIIGYVTGEGNPNADAGVLHFERTYYVHMGVGPNNERFTCPARTFKKNCPICEYHAKLVKNPESVGVDPDDVEKMAQTLIPKKRQLFNIIDDAEREKGIQVWEYSYHLFGKHLKKKIDNSEEDDNYEYFFTPDNGKRLKVGFSEEKGAGYVYYDGSDIEFKDRKPLDDDVTEQAVNLDEIITCPDYDELKKVFLGADESEDEDDKPKKTTKVKSKKAEVDEDEDEDTDEDDSEIEPKDSDEDEDSEEEDKPKPKKGAVKKHGLKKGMFINVLSGKLKKQECEVVDISADGSTFDLEDEAGKVHEDLDISDTKFTVVPTKEDEEDEDTDEDDSELEPEEKPAKKAPKGKAKKPRYDEDEDEDDEPDEEDSSDLEDDE